MSLNRRKKFMPVSLTLGLLLLMAAHSGCRSTSGLFLPGNNHPRTIEEARSAVIRDDPQRVEAVLNDLESRTASSSRMLLLLESGRLMDLSGESGESRRLFAEAASLAEQQDLNATFTVTESLQAALAMVTNDRALPYQAQLFERLFLYYFQSLNYLRDGEGEMARIELNKALRDMRWWKDNLPALRERTDRMLEQNAIRTNGAPFGPDLYSGSAARSSSDNALVYYLSALLHQASGNLDRAEIDYRNALAFVPDAEPFLHGLETLRDPSPDKARVVVIHESDWVAAKVPFSISVFIKRKLYTLSFPFYPDSTTLWRVPGLPLRMDPVIPEPYPVLSVNASVRKSLEEQFPAILLRQALRMLAKDQLQEEAMEEDPWLGFAVSIFSVLSDQPDLRSWLSLPASISVSDAYLLPGPVEIPGYGQVQLEPGEIHLFRFVSAQDHLIKVDSFPLPSYNSNK
jgi:hypothetical protein